MYNFIEISKRGIYTQDRIDFSIFSKSIAPHLPQPEEHAFLA
jgi:hypothetical protein